MDLNKIVFDERLVLEVPTDEVNDKGREAIMALIAKQTVHSAETLTRVLPSDWSWEWKVPRGTFAGTLPKRLQNWVYKKIGIKLPPPVISEIGNLAAQNTVGSATYHFDFNRTLDWKNGQFGDSKSCFWTQKTHMLPLLRGLGAFAVRLYDGPGKKAAGLGRAFILPWSSALPHGVAGPGDEIEALFVFNGYGLFKKAYQNVVYSGEVKQYGEMQTLDYAKLIATHLGLNYERVRVSVNGNFQDPLYVNNEGRSSVLVGPTDVIRKYKPKREDDENEYYFMDWTWNDTYIAKFLRRCTHCSKYLSIEQNEGHYFDEDETWYCNKCWETLSRACDVCGKISVRDKMFSLNSQRTHETYFYCRDHRYTKASICSRCGYMGYRDNFLPVIYQPRGKQHTSLGRYCRDCQEYLLGCSGCGRLFSDKLLQPQHNDQPLCPLCRGQHVHGLDAPALPEENDLFAPKLYRHLIRQKVFSNAQRNDIALAYLIENTPAIWPALDLVPDNVYEEVLDYVVRSDGVVKELRTRGGRLDLIDRYEDVCRRWEGLKFAAHKEHWTIGDYLD